MLLKADGTSARRTGCRPRTTSTTRGRRTRRSTWRTYGTSANGTEGDPARINVLNANLFTTFANNKLNEFHFTYSRETRPRTANASNLAGGHRHRLRAELPLRQSVLSAAECRRADLAHAVQRQPLDRPRRHTWKMGGEWMHTLNDQVFRGFFTGRYLFDSVDGFLRYTSPAGARRLRPDDGRLLGRRRT